MKTNKYGGGELLWPIIQLFRSIGDGVINIVQGAVLGGNVTTLIKLEGEEEVTDWVKVITATVIAVIVAIALVATGAWTLTAVGAATFGGTFILKTTVVAGILTGATGIYVATLAKQAWFPEDLYLPLYKVTAQEIFSNQVAIFDVNFFNPNNQVKDEKKEEEVTHTITIEQAEAYSQTHALTKEERENWSSICKFYGLDSQRYLNIQTGLPIKNKEELYSMDWSGKAASFYAFNDYLEQEPFLKYIAEKMQNDRTNNNLPKIDLDVTFFTGRCYLEDTYKDGDLVSQTLYGVLKAYYNNEFVYTVNYELLNFKPDATEFPAKITIIREAITESWTEQVQTTNEKVIESMAQKLQGAVSKWYFILRNIALLVLMLVLIYSGIRIVIASTAGEKSKYKERVIDWLVAICLIMIMHYIMVFAMELVEKITELVGTATADEIAEVITLDNRDEWKKSIEAYGELEGGYKLTNFYTTIEVEGKGDVEALAWPTDLMGVMRIRAQMSEEGTAKWVGYSLCFLVLVCYTLFFAWTYLRRVVYMAFLTMVAPLVAMTYPIDKITDGKAQAFNTWLREYIFNLMIQPLHLLLYNILIASAIELAKDNPLYAIVATGFIVPAEKLMRKFFGFEKAKTPGLLGGAAGAALAMSGAQSLMKKGHESNGSRGTEDDSDKIKWSSSNGVSPMDEVIDDNEYTPQNIRTSNTNQTSQSGAAGITIEQHADNSNSGDSSKVSIRTSGSPTVLEQAKKEEKEAEEKARRIAEANRISLLQQREEKAKLLAANQNKKRNDNFFKASLRATGAALGSYKRGLQNKAYKRIKNGRPVRAFARGALGLTGGATLGLFGLVAGIASGDPSKAFQYTTAGLAGGYGLGKRTAGSIVDTFSVDEKAIKDDIELAWYGTNYKKFKLQQEEEQLLENEEYIRYIRKTMGTSRKEAIEILENTGILCLRSGINNIEDIATVHKLTEELAEERILDLTELKDGKIEELTQEAQKQIHEEMLRTSIAMKKFSDRLPTDIKKMSDSKIKAYQRQFRKEIKERIEKELMKRGMTKEAASLQAESVADEPSQKIINGIIRFSNTKSDLTQI